MSMSSRLYERAQRVKHSFFERISTWRARVKQAEKARNDAPAPIDALEPRLLMSGNAIGHVFADTNGDGLFDSNEQGLADRVVFVDSNGDGIRGEAERFVRTEKDGSFSFGSLPGGGMRVSAEQLPGWERTTSQWFYNSRTGDVAGLNFGFAPFDLVKEKGDAGLHVFGGRTEQINQIDADPGSGSGVTSERTLLDQPGRAWARWSYGQLATGSYEVFASWDPSDELATDAPFTVFDGHERIDVVRVDQTVAASDRLDAKGNWRSLGVFDVSNGAMTVEVNQVTAFGKPIAIDALRVMRVEAAPSAASENNTDVVAEPGAEASDVPSNRLDKRGADRANWQFGDLVKGQYAVYAKWNVADDLATDAPFAIYDGKQRIDSLRIDQSVVPSDLNDAEGDWLQLGVYDLSGDLLRIESHHATKFGKPVEIVELRVVQLSAAPVDPPTPTPPATDVVSFQKPERIQRDQVNPFARVGDLEFHRNKDGQAEVSFVVWLSRPSRDTSFVEYVLEDTTKNRAHTKGQVTGVVQFDPGESVKVVTIPYGSTSDLKSSKPEVRLRRGDGVILIDEAFRPDVQFVSFAATTGGTSVGLQGPSTVEENSVYEIQPILLAGGPVTAATVDWGDGNQDVYTSLPSMLTHTYTSGTTTSYDIVINYDDGTGAVDSDPFTVQVVDVSPTINISGATQVDEGTLYELSLDITDVVDDLATNLEINWGDGTILDYATTTTTAQHTYLNGPASHDITVTWTDQDGDHVWGTTTGGWTLDETFDVDGHVETDFGGYNYANAAAFQADGKLVVVGRGGTNNDFAIVRYLADGSLDLTFGNGDAVVDGRTTIDVSGGYDYAEDVFIETDVNDNVTGILVAGSAYGGAAVIRLDADGDLDLNFGGGDGIVELSDHSISNFYYRDLDVQSDGKILIGGDLNGMSVARLNADGSLDTSFAAGAGYVTTPTANSSWMQGMGLQSDGKIVLGGDASNGFVVTRVLSTGAIDTTFASGAGEGVAFPGQEYPYSSGFEIDSNDRIVMTGNAYGGLLDSNGYTTENVFAMARFEADGDNDNAFGTNGVLTENFAAGWNEYANGLALTDNDEILILFDANNPNIGQWDQGAVLYNADGTRNLELDHDGAYFTGDSYGGSPITSLYGATTNADGDIVLVGQSVNGFAATRLTRDTTFTVDVNNVGPTLVFSGDAQVDVGTAYTLDLTHIGPAGSSFDDWFINWGDGSDPQQVSSTAAFATHDYSLAGAGNYTITVHGQDVGGTYDATLDGIPGQLDNSFGINGIVQESHVDGARIKDIAQQSDGRTIAAVEDDDGKFVLMRFEADGSVDMSFGVSGRLTMTLGTSAGANAVAVQQDDKIVATGYSYGAADQDIAVVRLNADGSTDDTFGADRNGIVIMDIDGWDSYGGQDVGIKSDGSIVIASSGDSYDFVVTQLDTTGHIDDDFGTGGTQFIEFAAYGSYIEALSIEDDDQVVLVGSAYSDTNYTDDFAIARLNTDGSLDNSFGEDANGKVMIDFAYGDGSGGSYSAYDYARDVAIEDDGSIVIVGSTYGYSSDFAIVRLDSLGHVDGNFGQNSDGRVITDLIPDDDGYGGPGTTGGYSDYAEGVAIQADGKIVVAGSSYNPGSGSDDFVVARYTTDGDLDLDFDDNGYVYNDIDGSGSYDQASAILIQPDHRIIVAGAGYGGGSQYDGELARYFAGPKQYEITVTDSSAPAITATGSSSVDEGSLYTLNLTALNFTPTTWTINWGDSPTNDDEQIDGSETQWTHTYADGADGIVITVTATDGTDTLEAAPIIVGVLEVAPALTITGSSYSRINSPYQLDLSAVDPGTDTINSWTIDWGDGAVETIIGNPLFVEHPYNTFGQHTITATASDDAGTYSSNALIVDNVATATLTFAGDTEVDEDATYTLTLTYDDPAGLGIDDWLIDWGDGQGEQEVTATGTMTLATYIYPDGPANHTITVRGQDEADTYDAYIGGPSGELDSTFGTEGKANHADISGINHIDARDVALQSDGRIVAAVNESNSKFVLMRFNPDGSIDNTFGTAGRREITDFTGWAGATSIAVQADDKIVAVGYADGATDQDTAIVRLNADGTDDATFGNVNGTLLVDAGGWDTGEDVAIVTDNTGVLTQGHIAIASYGGNGGLVAVLLDENGATVNTFGNQGVAEAMIGTDWATSYAVAIHDEGVVVAGDVWFSGNSTSDFAVARFDETGYVDADFNGGSASTVNFTYDDGYGGIANADEYARDLAVDSSGNIVVVGNTYDSTYSSNFAVVRLTSTGSLDTTFGPNSDGFVTTDLVTDNGSSGNSDYAEAIAFQSDGKIVVGGNSYNSDNSSNDFIVARYDSNGDLDIGFDGNSYAHTNFADIADGYGGTFASNDYVYSLLIQPDGKILVAGQTYGTSNKNEIGMARFGAGETELEVTVHDAVVDPLVAISGATEIDEGASYLLTLDPMETEPVTWTIDWGDGEIETVPGSLGTAIHEFTDNLASPVSIQVSANDTINQYAADPLTVAIHDVSPTLSAVGATISGLDIPYYLVLDYVDPGDDQITNWTIDWGDGAIDSINVDPSIQTYPMVVSHPYDTINTYTVQVSATNDDGTFNAQQLDVAIATVSASIAGQTAVGEGATYVLDLSTTGLIDDVQWEITWGDGSVDLLDGNPDQAFHVFQDGPNNFDITAKVFRGGTLAVTPAETINVQVSEQTPQFALTANVVWAKNVEFEIVLDADNPGNDDIEWLVAWGDGDTETVSGNHQRVTHPYAATGNFNVTVTPSEVPSGAPPTAYASIAHQVVITDIVITGDTVVDEASNYELQIIMADALRNALSEIEVVWDYDGSQMSGESVGPAATNATHVYADESASTSIKVLADDGTTTFTSNALVIEVVDSPPILTYSSPERIDEGSLYSMTLSADNLDEVEIDQWQIDWGDGPPQTFDHVAGTTVYPATVVKSTPYADGPNEYQIRVTATDTNGIQYFAHATSLPRQSHETGDASRTFGFDATEFQRVIDYNGSIVTIGSVPTGQTSFDFSLTQSTVDSNTGLISSVLTATADLAGGSDYAKNLVVQNVNGVDKFLAVGYTFSGFDYDVSLVRFNLDGTLDNTFNPDSEGNGGRLVSALPGHQYAYDVAIGNNGAIFVVGSTFENGGEDILVLKFDENGTRDETFNAQGDSTHTVTDLGGDDAAYAVEVDAHGRVVVAGASRGSIGWDIAMARYLSDGTLDVTFGENNDGTVVDGFGLGESGAVATNLQAVSNGYIISGHTETDAAEGDNAWFAMQIEADGTPDESFGSTDDGTVLIDIGTGRDEAFGFDLTDSGQILLSGTTWNSSTLEFDLSIALVSTSGQLENGFGASGVSITDWAGIEDRGHDAIRLADGRIYMVTGSAFADQVNRTAELSADGVLLSSFVTINNVSPVVTLAGGAGPINEFSDYSITLTQIGTDPGQDAISEWLVNWGDGTVEAYTGQTHQYEVIDSHAATQDFVISAAAVDDDGTYNTNAIVVTVNNLSPTTPANLTAVVDAVDGHSVDLSWAASLNTTDYHIFRATDPDGPFLEIGANEVINGGLLTAADDNLTPDTTYYYYVTAENYVVGETSAQSATVEVTPQQNIPTAVMNLMASIARIEPGGQADAFNQIALTWDRVDDVENRPTEKYVVERAVDNGVFEVVGEVTGADAQPASIAFIDDEDVWKTRNYTYRIIPVNGDESGPGTLVHAFASPVISKFDRDPLSGVIDLAWSGGPGYVKYEVYRSPTPGLDISAMADVETRSWTIDEHDPNDPLDDELIPAETTWSDHQVTASSVYYYKVRARYFSDPDGLVETYQTLASYETIALSSDYIDAVAGGHELIDRIPITFNGNIQDVEHFTIYRDDDVHEQDIAASSGTIDWTDKWIGLGTIYTYSIEAHGAEVPLVSFDLSVETVPNAPQHFFVHRYGTDDEHFKFAWASNPNADSYHLYRKDDNGAFVEIAQVTGASHTIWEWQMPSGGDEVFMLRAKNESGLSPDSRWVRPAPDPTKTTQTRKDDVINSPCTQGILLGSEFIIENTDDDDNDSVADKDDFDNIAEDDFRALHVAVSTADLLGVTLNIPSGLRVWAKSGGEMRNVGTDTVSGGQEYTDTGSSLLQELFDDGEVTLYMEATASLDEAPIDFVVRYDNQVTGQEETETADTLLITTIPHFEADLTGSDTFVPINADDDDGDGIDDRADGFNANRSNSQSPNSVLDDDDANQAEDDFRNIVITLPQAVHDKIDPTKARLIVRYNEGYNAADPEGLVFSPTKHGEKNRYVTFSKPPPMTASDQTIRLWKDDVATGPAFNLVDTGGLYVAPEGGRPAVGSYSLADLGYSDGVLTLKVEGIEYGPEEIRFSLDLDGSTMWLHNFSHQIEVASEKRYIAYTDINVNGDNTPDYNEGSSYGTPFTVYLPGNEIVKVKLTGWTDSAAPVQAPGGSGTLSDPYYFDRPGDTLRFWYNGNVYSPGDEVTVSFDENDTDESRRVVFQVEGIHSGSETIDVYYKKDGESYQASPVQSISVDVVAPQLGVDSDNGTTTGDSATEVLIDEQIEMLDERPGQFVSVNDVDRDFDGIPDFADGLNLDGRADDDSFASSDQHIATRFDENGNVIFDAQQDPEMKFVPITFELPSPIDLNKARVQLIYSASNPSEVMGSAVEPVVGEQPTVYSAPAGIRLWTHPSGVTNDNQRSQLAFNDPAAIASGKAWYVPPTEDGAFYGKDDLLKLGFEVSPTGNRTVTLYVEAVTAGEYTIELKLNPDGLTGYSGDDSGHYIVSEVVNITAGLGNMTIDSDNNGLLSPEDEVIENTQFQTGKIIVINDGDKNDNDVADFADVIDVNEDPSIYFVPLEVDLPTGIDLDLAHLKFKYDGSDPGAIQDTTVAGENGHILPDQGSLRIWYKGDAQASNYSFIVSDTYIKASDLGAQEGQKLTLYVEAIRPSSASGDLEIEMSIDLDGADEVAAGEDPVVGSDHVFVVDTVKLTAVQASNSPYSFAGVRLTDGALTLNETDLVSVGYMGPWTSGRTFTNMAGYDQDDALGSGWSLDLPQLVQAGSAIVLQSAGETRIFDLVAVDDLNTQGIDETEYSERFGSLATLSKETGEYTLFETDGGRWVFNTFSTMPSSGEFAKYISPSGREITATYDAHGQLKTITNGGDKIEYSYYAYSSELDADDPQNRIAGKLKSIEHDRAKTSSNEYLLGEVVNFTYYTENEHESETEYRGHLGDLKQVDLYQGKVDDDRLIESSIYRYAKKDSRFEASQLKLVLSGDAYHVAVGTLEGSQEIAELDNSKLEAFADIVYGYNSNTDQPRIDSFKLQGAGSTATESNNSTKIDLGGDTSGYYTISYGSEENSSGENLSRYSVTLQQVSDPSDSNSGIGPKTTTYMNVFGQVLLSDTTYDNDAHIVVANKYDEEARLIQTADSLAVASYDPNSEDGSLLIAYQPTLGAITRYFYADQTTASANSQGCIEGLLKEVTIQKGENGNPIRQQSMSYFLHEYVDERDLNDPNDDLYIYSFPIASESVYAVENVYDPTDDDVNRAGEIKTSYSYDPDEYIQSQPGRVETTLPTIAESQNGDGSVGTIVQYYDDYGRVTWTKDSGNILHYQTYDDATNIVLKSISDVDPNLIAPPEIAWETLHAAGSFEHHETTVAAIDYDGNVTKIVDAAGRSSTFQQYRLDSRIITIASDGILTTRNEFDRQTNILSTSTKDANNNYVSASRVYFDLAGRPVYTDRYVDIHSVPFREDDKEIRKDTEQTEQTGEFYREVSVYDDLGRNDRIINAVGTITRFRFDQLGQILETWVGTDDRWGTANAFDPGTGVNSDANLALISSSEYDARGLVTSTTLHPSGVRTPSSSYSNRKTDFLYDFSGQLVGVREGAGLSTEDIDKLHPTFSYTDYDNLGRPIAQLLYDRSGLNESAVLSQGHVYNANNQTWEPVDQTHLRSMAASNYDNRSQVFQTFVFDVEPDYSSDPLEASGAKSKTYNASEAIVSGIWYDQLGRTIKQHSQGQAASKTIYDHLSRPVTQYITDAAGDPTIGTAGSHAAAASVSDDHVLVQINTVYDDASNLTLTAMYERRHDYDNPGALDVPNASRVSYIGNWYDAFGRPTATVNYGTNGGTSPATDANGNPIRTADDPGFASFDGFDEYLRTETKYTQAGRVASVSDGRTKNVFVYDDLGRVAKRVDAYQDGEVTGGLPDSDQVVEYLYNGNDQMIQMLRPQPDGEDTLTEYNYGTSKGNETSSNSFDHLHSVIHKTVKPGPDKVTGSKYYAYDAVGQELSALTYVPTETGLGLEVSIKREITFDDLGRQNTDKATFLNDEHFDDWADTQQISYDSFGRAYKFTTLGNDQVRNEVRRTFGGFDQVLTEYQQTNGATTASSEHVIYQYAGVDDANRLISITYPTFSDETLPARVITYQYDNGIDNSISRISSIADSRIGGTVESYSYIGLDKTVDFERPDSQVDLSYVNGNFGGENNDGADIYSGFDRFGRVIDQMWHNGSTMIDRFQYAYDARSNPLYKLDLVQTQYSELYQANGADATSAYDNLSRIKQFKRGELTKSDPNGRYNKIDGDYRDDRTWNWNFSGDWASYYKGGTLASTFSEDEGVYTTNGTKSLIPAHFNRSIRRDAWGRLSISAREFRHPDSINEDGEIVEDGKVNQLARVWYYYDALGRMIRAQSVDDSGEIASSTHFYYAGGKIIKQWERDDNGDRINVETVWSAGHANMMVLQDKEKDGVIDRRYVQQDASGNITSLLTKQSGSWQIYRRFYYDPFGMPSARNAQGEILARADYDFNYLYRGGYMRLDNHGLDLLIIIANTAYDPIIGRPPTNDRTQPKAITVPDEPQWYNHVWNWSGAGFAVKGIGKAIELLGDATEWLGTQAITLGQSFDLGFVDDAIEGVGIFYTAVGSIEQGLGQGLIGFDPVNAASHVIEDYRRYDEAGIGFVNATILKFHPSVGLVEAFDGVSYGARDLGRELSSTERWSRGLISFGATVGVGTGLYKGFTHGAGAAFADKGFAGVAKKVGNNFFRLATFRQPKCFVGTTVVLHDDRGNPVAVANVPDPTETAYLVAHWRELLGGGLLLTGGYLLVHAPEANWRRRALKRLRRMKKKGWRFQPNAALPNGTSLFGFERLEVIGD